jgi:hypothetical protein
MQGAALFSLNSSVIWGMILILASMNEERMYRLGGIFSKMASPLSKTLITAGMILIGSALTLYSVVPELSPNWAESLLSKVIM